MCFDSPFCCTTLISPEKPQNYSAGKMQSKHGFYEPQQHLSLFYYCYNAFLLYLSTHTHTNPQMNAPRATWYLVFYPRIFPHADWRSPLPPELQPPQLVTMVQRDLLHTGLKSHTSGTQHCTRDKGQAFLGVFYSYTVLQTPAPEQDINNKSADMHIICKEFSNRTPTIKHCMNSCVMG